MNIDKQTEEIIEFLKLTHPFLNNLRNKECIEIRAISRESNYDYNLSRSFNIWKFNTTSINLLKEYLRVHDNRYYCLYYSVYTFDYNKSSKTKEGKNTQKGHINTTTAEFTEEIVLDFDDITKTDMFNYNKILQDLNINPLWLWTGHGYHCHIFLDEKIYDSLLLEKMVLLFRSRGFKVDTNCRDAARIMRLPYTYNYKCINSDKYIEEPPLCNIEIYSNSRYLLQDIIQKLESLEIIEEDINEEYLRQVEKQTNKEQLTNLNENFDKITKVNYPYIDKYDLPIPIKKILTFCPEGYRNQALGFLIRYLKQYVKISREQILKILEMWSVIACKPTYEDFSKDFLRLYNIGGLNYTKELSEQYGLIEFTKIESKTDIYIPNEFIKDFINLSGKQIRAYLAIKLLEHIEKETSLKNIAEILSLSERATYTNLASLNKTKHIFIKKGNRTKKEVYTFHSNKLIALSQGYIRLSFNDIKAYISDLRDNEIKLYIHMQYKCYDTGMCLFSQIKLGENLDLKQNTVSNLIKGLASKYYIKVDKYQVNNNIFYCQYTLLR